VSRLVLNASFEPLTIVPGPRAIRLVPDGKAETLEADSGCVSRSGRRTVAAPSVI
jgi:hypothetical protein